MQKLVWIAIVVALVSACYLIMLITMPLVSDLAATANSTMNATSNMSLYPGTSEALMASPWILWFIPGAIGIGVIIVILKS